MNSIISSSALSNLQKMKISCLSQGIKINENAMDLLSNGGKDPLSIHEYATTGGITLEFEGGIFVNAPIDEWYCNGAEAILDIDKKTRQFRVFFRGEIYPASVLPLPGYLETRDSKGNLIIDSTMSHADRVRFSPIFSGCSFNCQFCDVPRKKYISKPVEQILEGYGVACKDKLLPVKHALISGGTPSQRDYGYIDDVYERMIKTIHKPVDVMLAPRKDDIIDRLADWGVFGYSINLELFDEEIASRIMPQKHRLGHKLFGEQIEKAVQRVGKNGRVRSLLIVGLEPQEKTLEGVEFLARLGCDPVLSPFRPAQGTSLNDLQPPSYELLEQIYLESLEIVERYGVKLGPRCLPCQHNTLAFSDGSSSYYFNK